MLNICLGNFLIITLRLHQGLKDFFGNWDFQIGSLGISYCWHRGHRLGISWRPIIRTTIDGKMTSRYCRRQRYWAFGYTAVYEDNHWVDRIGPLWRFAFPDRYHGEWRVDAHPSNLRRLYLRPKIVISGQDLLSFWRNPGYRKI